MAVYNVVVERDPETGWLVGLVIELPGCYSQAPDRTTLEDNMREALEVYLETAGSTEPASRYAGTFPLEVVV
jgi:predicted RNase H-like HicB family nuclease